MKDLQSLVKNFQPPTQQQTQSNFVDEFAKRVIDKVFRELAVIFPAWKHNWKTQQEIDGAKKQWIKAFVENDINTMEQISAGFQIARKADTDFLPSCGKFISWCKPSPETMGWPSAESCLRECVKFRNNQKLFTNKPIRCRPLIVELCKRVDWWLMNNVATQQEQKKATAHFAEVYSELLKSGYVEPQETDNLRLPTQEVVESGLSEQQKEDRHKRHLEHIKDIRKKLKGVKK